MSNKEKAISFLKMAGTGEVRAAYEKFVGANFIHHNQYFKGDRESLMTAMEEAHQVSPNKAIEIKKSYQDGDTVITHSHVVKDAAEIAVVHIFRFDGDKIVELWDLGQLIDPKSPNENGAF
jgi:predicted SnoaL-like aldol condensation-catalyzing enzyme